MPTILQQETDISENTHHRGDRQHHVQLIRRYGSLTSDALLDPSCHYYMENSIQGLIGYKLENKTAVVFGDPVCAPKDTAALTENFHDFCREQGWSTVYISTSEDFARWAIGNTCSALIQFGDEFYIDPHNDPREKTGTHGSLVRRKVRHAQREGVSVSEYTQRDEKMENAIDQVGLAWLEARKGPQIHISHVRMFNDRQGKRWIYAKQGDRIVGAAVLNRLEKHDGWLLNHIVFSPDAPNGTPELLVVTALETTAKEGCHYVSFGNSPASSLGETSGLSMLSTYVARLAFKMANRYFHLDGHKMFWDKFTPESRRSFLLFAQPRIGLQEIRALKSALNVTI